MADKIFSRCNPNADIFLIPGDEGATEDDRYNASIGDATLKHVDSLGNKVIYWESFVCMPDGNLFAIEPNLSYTESDEFNIRSVQDVNKFMKEARIPDKYKDVYIEAFQNELQKQEASEDVLDQKENLVSYEDWESNPGMSTSAWDLPQTPKPHVRYVGNCHQMFYDDFPEDHPDAKFINNILNIINRDWDEITPKFVRALSRRIESAPIQRSTIDTLTNILDSICNSNDNPEIAVVAGLRTLDREWGKRLFKACRRQELQRDPIYNHLVTMCREYDTMIEQGTSVNKVFNTLKTFGRSLFNKRQPLLHLGIQGRMKKSHWYLYHRMKKRYAPIVIVNKVDINRAYRNELAKALGISRRVAMLLITKRPFESLDDVRRTGLVKYEDVIRQDPETTVLVERIRTAGEEAIKANNLKLLTSLPADFIKEQKSGSSKLSSDEWKRVWECYNIMKTRVLRAINQAKN